MRLTKIMTVISMCLSFKRNFKSHKTKLGTFVTWHNTIFLIFGSVIGNEAEVSDQTKALIFHVLVTGLACV